MKLTYSLRRLHLRTPFVTNKGTTENFPQVFVQLEEGNYQGTGAAVLTNEPGMSFGEVTYALDDYAKLFANTDFDQAYSLSTKLVATMPLCPSAFAAVDMAMLDLAAQLARQPVDLFLGLSRRSNLQTAISLGDMPSDTLLEQVQAFAKWPVLKLKLSSKSDPSILGAVRKRYDGRIWVDGNSAWTLGQALEVAVELKRCGVELLEQPIKSRDLPALRELRVRSGLKLIADEDCRSLEDVPALVGCVDGVNIKIFRCGGMRRALEMIRRARSVGLEVMLGCKTESCVGVIAAAHLAGLSDYLDLDGHLDILDDPYTGMDICQGEISLHQKNGLGLSSRPTIIPL